MSRRQLRVLGWALPVLVVTGSFAAEEGGARSPRNANYRIEVRLDPAAKTLAGRQVLSWRNLQATATDELWVHLYWNAWRNSRSTWMLEDRFRGRSDRGERPERGDWSSIEVDAVRLLASEERSAADLGDRWRYASPDDGNPDDRTVMVIALPEPVEPGESVEFELEFRARIPRTFARTGYRGNFFFIAHWYPAVAVYEADGWNSHQFHAGTEFYSDYGVYDVAITLPEEFVLGASGRRIERTPNGDGTTTHRYRAEDVHNFAWTASPDYVVRERRFEVSGLPAVDMRLLIQPEHLSQADRHFAATAAALEQFGKWYGPYVYDSITVVDPAYGSGAGGMEYPTLFTCGTRLFNPLGGGSPESVTVHEAGHQFWYGIVGNNEFEHAWLDEGLNTFSTARTMDVVFGESKLVRRYLSLPGSRNGERRRRGGFLPFLFPDLTRSREVSGNRLDGYRRSATWDAQATPTYRYFPRSASAISYNKTALWLHTLERMLGWDRLQPAMAAFFDRYRFAHPEPDDFFAVIEEVTGEELDWFVDQVYRGSETFDYAVASVSSRPAAVRGLVEGEEGLIYASVGDGDDGERPYRTEVVVRRLGDGRFPVTVRLVFDDGERLDLPWDGEDRWRLFVEEREARLEYAVVDPERVLLLDLDVTNNSRLRRSQAELPARKWAAKWMIWLQDLLQTFTFFV